MNKPFMSRQETAEYCSSQGLPVAVATLAKYATVGGGPEFQLFGRFPRYTKPAVDAWIASRLSAPRCNTSQAA